MRFKEYPTTYDELSECLVQWGYSKSGQRFGQWMVNNYVRSEVVWPELFYCESTGKAIGICYREICKGFL